MDLITNDFLAFFFLYLSYWRDKFTYLKNRIKYIPFLDAKYETLKSSV